MLLLMSEKTEFLLYILLFFFIHANYDYDIENLLCCCWWNMTLCLNPLFIVCLDYTLIFLSSTLSFLCWWYPNASLTMWHIGLLSRIFSLSSCSITCVSYVTYIPILSPCWSRTLYPIGKGLRIKCSYTTSRHYNLLSCISDMDILSFPHTIINKCKLQKSIQYIQVYL